MTLIYLVLAHQHPAQLVRLLQRVLSVLDDRAVVHVDATADLRPFAEAIEASGLAARVVVLEDRVDVRWGGFGAVTATLRALKQAVDEPADAYVLLSGADYPVRPVEGLHAELADGAVRMQSTPIPDLIAQKPLSRLEHVFIAPKDRGDRVMGQFNRVLGHLPKRDVRRGLEGFAPYGGAQWWAMPHDVAVEVLAFVERHPRFVRFFSRSLVPDESFFQTIVAAVALGVPVRPELTWADWSRIVPPGSPSPLLNGDLERVRTAADAGHWFARKFDPELSGELLDQIDAELLGVRDSSAR